MSHRTATRATAGASGVLATVETPVAVIDLPRVRANAAKTVEFLEGHGLRWRPHVKTHKSTRVARIQLDAGARGLTVATPREAEIMSTVCDDLLVAYPPVGSRKVERLAALPERVRLTVALDSARSLRDVAAASRRAGRTTGVLVELDVGMRRVGVAEPDEVVRLASEIRETDGVEYRGLLFYPGHIRTPGPDQGPALTRLAEHLDRTVEALGAAELAPEVVSGGSTPTLRRSGELPHVTEIRAGTCIFNDRDTAELGAAAWEECAYSVLTTVVSAAVPGQVVVDAGSKAMAKEVRGGADGSYGVVRGRPDVAVRALSEEHGVIDTSRGAWRPEVGDRIRLIPNHVCVSVNLQDHLLAVDGETVEVWPLEARGRGPA